MEYSIRKYLLNMLIGGIMGILILICIGIIPNDHRDINKIKEELLKKDSLLKVKEGEYIKLVNDMYTRDALLEQLKKDNRELYESLKNKKPIMTTQMVVKPIIKKDTIKLRDTIVLDKSLKLMESYYPDKSSYFIKYTAIIDSIKVREDWNFNELPINISIVEKKKGLFEAQINGPKWLTVNDLKVNSLPLSTTQPKRRMFLIGSGMEYDIKNKNITQYFQTGMKINSYGYTMGINSVGVLKLGINKYF